MTINPKRLCLLGLVAASATLLACNSGSSGGSSSSSSGETGQMSLAVTDAPVDDAVKVVLRFTHIKLKPIGAAEGEEIRIDLEDAPREVDLLALQGEDSELLFENEEIPAGEYEWIRFMVEAAENQVAGNSRLVTTSYIEFRPDKRPEEERIQQLVIPGGAQAGVQTQGTFTVPADGVIALTVDFDLRKLITEGRGAVFDGFHRMRRTGLRIIENTDVGVIFGDVDESLIDHEEQCLPHEDEGGYFACPGIAVYIYEGHNEPLLPVFIETTEDGDDIEAPGNPVTTANVRWQLTENDEGEEVWRYSYNAGFLESGDYTVALTFNAADDDPESDAEIPFAFVYPEVELNPGERKRLDFPGDADEVEQENGDGEEEGEEENGDDDNGEDDEEEEV